MFAVSSRLPRGLASVGKVGRLRSVVPGRELYRARFAVYRGFRQSRRLLARPKILRRAWAPARLSKTQDAPPRSSLLVPKLGVAISRRLQLKLGLVEFLLCLGQKTLRGDVTELGEDLLV